MIPLLSIRDGPSSPKLPSEMALGALWALLQPRVVMCHQVGYRASGFGLLHLPCEREKGVT